MLAGGGQPGVAAPAQLQGKTGLEIMQAMLSGELPYPHIAETQDFALIEVAHGKAVFQGTPQLKHYNPMGTAHGGWFATLLDSALGCAVQTTLPAGTGYTTAELSVNIVRAAH
ncbi:MAG: PaaI family thioesterase, partial [Comamonas sp.]